MNSEQSNNLADNIKPDNKDIWYELDYDGAHHNQELPILITNQESLQVLTIQLQNIIANEPSDDLIEINYAEEQNLEEIPFKFIRLQDSPTEYDNSGNAGSNLMGLGCLILFVGFIITFIVSACYGFLTFIAR